MNSNPQVMAFFPATLTPVQSNALLARFMSEAAQSELGIWAVERKEDGLLLGFTGMHQVDF